MNKENEQKKQVKQRPGGGINLADFQRIKHKVDVSYKKNITTRNSGSNLIVISV